MPRIAPATPPFAPEIQAALGRIMPAGVPPLGLFTTVARNPRAFGRFMAGGLLGRGAITLRQREIVILRACARCGCGYEWGVHVAFFAAQAGLTERQIAATTGADDAAWSDEERLLVWLVDELHERSTVGDELWRKLEAAFTAEQLIELLMLAGLYHMVSFLANALALAPEPFAPPFRPAGRGDAA